MYKWNKKTQNNWTESKICIAKVLCIFAKITKIYQYNEYHLKLMICLRTLLRIYEKRSNLEKF